MRPSGGLIRLTIFYERRAVTKLSQPLFYGLLVSKPCEIFIPQSSCGGEKTLLEGKISEEKCLFKLLKISGMWRQIIVSMRTSGDFS